MNHLYTYKTIMETYKHDIFAKENRFIYMFFMFNCVV